MRYPKDGHAGWCRSWRTWTLTRLTLIVASDKAHKESVKTISQHENLNDCLVCRIDSGTEDRRETKKVTHEFRQHASLLNMVQELDSIRPDVFGHSVILTLIRS